ncbi:MAG: YceI family protein [Ardenticatenaceae bacterium]
MTKRIILQGIGLALIIVVLITYVYLKPPATASAPIQTVPIEGKATGTALSDDVDTVEAAATTEAAEPLLFEIEQTGSEVRYMIDEVLAGFPNTVVGVTDQVAGQIAIDPLDPGTAKVGTIMINARTFATDDSARDRAVQNQILQTNQHEYITFVPTALAGLPESAVVGEPYSFRIVGDLTIREIRREVTWDVTVLAVTEDHLEGIATTTIHYADWGMSIPEVPFVADASDEVRLELDFSARAS